MLGYSPGDRDVVSFDLCHASMMSVNVPCNTTNKQTIMTMINTFRIFFAALQTIYFRTPKIHSTETQNKKKKLFISRFCHSETKVHAVFTLHTFTYNKSVCIFAGEWFMSPITVDILNVSIETHARNIFLHTLHHYTFWAWNDKCVFGVYKFILERHIFDGLNCIVYKENSTLEDSNSQ